MRTGAGGRMQPHTQGRQGPQELDEARRTLPGASEWLCVPAWISDTPATKLGGKRCLLPQPQPVAMSSGCPGHSHHPRHADTPSGFTADPRLLRPQGCSANMSPGGELRPERRGGQACRNPGTQASWVLGSGTQSSRTAVLLLTPCAPASPSPLWLGAHATRVSTPQASGGVSSLGGGLYSTDIFLTVLGQRAWPPTLTSMALSPTGPDSAGPCRWDAVRAGAYKRWGHQRP